jgi:hypothetical protein
MMIIGGTRGAARMPRQPLTNESERIGTFEPALGCAAKGQTRRFRIEHTLS